VTLARRPNSAFAFTFNHATATAMPRLPTMAVAALLTRRPVPAAKRALFIQRIVPSRHFSSAACRAQPQSAAGQI